MKKLLYISALMILFSGSIFGQFKLSINNCYIREYGGTNPGLGGTPIYIVLASPNANSIITGNGWIISESEFDMFRWVVKNNTGTYQVPFGYGSSYALPLTLNIGTAGISGGNSGWIDFSTWHTIADNWTGVTSLTGPPSDVKNMAAAYTSMGSPSATDDSYNAVDRFWVINASSYDQKPGLNGVSFTYISHAGAPSEVSSPNVFAESNLLAQRFNPTITSNGSWGDWLGIGGTDVISGPIGTVNSGAITASNFYRSWTLSNSNSPLPIQISSFTAQCNNGTALIQWTSQAELNNDYYTVKKTSDNIHFETVGTVKGAGTISLPQNYSLTDNSPISGSSYYFLYQTDMDENTTEVMSIPFAGCETSGLTTINGFNTTNYIEIAINSIDNSNFNISLLNMLGQIVINENHPVAIGNNVIHLNNSMSPGIYILNVKNDKVSYSKKLVIGVR
jgi:hypothetical protein